MIPGERMYHQGDSFSSSRSSSSSSSSAAATTSTGGDFITPESNMMNQIATKAANFREYAPDTGLVSGTIFGPRSSVGDYKGESERVSTPNNTRKLHVLTAGVPASAFRRKYSLPCVSSARPLIRTNSGSNWADTKDKEHKPSPHSSEWDYKRDYLKYLQDFRRPSTPKMGVATVESPAVLSDSEDRRQTSLYIRRPSISSLTLDKQSQSVKCADEQGEDSQVQAGQGGSRAMDTQRNVRSGGYGGTWDASHQQGAGQVTLNRPSVGGGGPQPQRVHHLRRHSVSTPPSYALRQAASPRIDQDFQSWTKPSGPSEVKPSPGSERVIFHPGPTRPSGPGTWTPVYETKYQATKRDTESTPQGLGHAIDKGLCSYKRQPVQPPPLRRYSVTYAPKTDCRQTTVKQDGGAEQKVKKQPRIRRRLVRRASYDLLDSETDGNSQDITELQEEEGTTLKLSESHTGPGHHGQAAPVAGHQGRVHGLSNGTGDGWAERGRQAQPSDRDQQRSRSTEHQGPVYRGYSLKGHPVTGQPRRGSTEYVDQPGHDFADYAKPSSGSHGAYRVQGGDRPSYEQQQQRQRPSVGYPDPHPQADDIQYTGQGEQNDRHAEHSMRGQHRRSSTELTGQPQQMVDGVKYTGQRQQRGGSVEYTGQRQQRGGSVEYMGQRQQRDDSVEYTGQRQPRDGYVEYTGPRQQRDGSVEYTGQRPQRDGSVEYTGQRQPRDGSVEYMGQRQQRDGSVEYMGQRQQRDGSVEYMGQHPQRDGSVEYTGQRQKRDGSVEYTGQRPQRDGSVEYPGQRQQRGGSVEYTGPRLQRDGSVEYTGPRLQRDGSVEYTGPRLQRDGSVDHTGHRQQTGGSVACTTQPSLQRHNSLDRTDSQRFDAMPNGIERQSENQSMTAARESMNRNDGSKNVINIKAPGDVQISMQTDKPIGIFTGNPDNPGFAIMAGDSRDGKPPTIMQFPLQQAPSQTHTANQNGVWRFGNMLVDSFAPTSPRSDGTQAMTFPGGPGYPPIVNINDMRSFNNQQLFPQRALHDGLPLSNQLLQRPTWQGGADGAEMTPNYGMFGANAPLALADAAQGRRVTGPWRRAPLALPYGQIGDSQPTSVGKMGISYNTEAKTHNPGLPSKYDVNSVDEDNIADVKDLIANFEGRRPSTTTSAVGKLVIDSQESQSSFAIDTNSAESSPSSTAAAQTIKADEPGAAKFGTSDSSVLTYQTTANDKTTSAEKDKLQTGCELSGQTDPVPESEVGEQEDDPDEDKKDQWVLTDQHSGGKPCRLRPYMSEFSMSEVTFDPKPSVST